MFAFAYGMISLHLRTLTVEVHTLEVCTNGKLVVDEIRYDDCLGDNSECKCRESSSETGMLVKWKQISG